MKRGDEVLQNELVEQSSLRKVIVKGSPAAGSKICMQFKKELWEGRILSIHGKYIALMHLSITIKHACVHLKSVSNLYFMNRCMKKARQGCYATKCNN